MECKFCHKEANVKSRSALITNLITLDCGHSFISSDSVIAKELCKETNEPIQQDLTEQILEQVRADSLSTTEDPKASLYKEILSSDGYKPYHYQLEGMEFAETSGFRCLIADEMGLGKEQPLDSLLMTPSGYIRMGDIRINDDIFGSDGGIYKVTGVFPQGMKSTYRVTFTDGSSTKCGEEHLWNVNTSLRAWQGLAPRIKTLSQIKQEGIKNNQGNNKHFIPIALPLNFPSASLPIDPYVLGLLLGDGGLSVKDRITFSSKDGELISTLNSELSRFDAYLYHSDECNYQVRNPSKLIKELEKLELKGTKSNNKFIPLIYKNSSIQQRLQLLRGLMDTDGSIASNKVIEYTSVSKELIEDVKYLVQSLGGVAYQSERYTNYTYKEELKTGQLSYRLIINIQLNPFELVRKAIEYTPNKKYKPSRAIESITYVGLEECQCISVSAPDKLYLTDECIVTHNTIQAIGTIIRNIEDLQPVLVLVKSSLKIQWLKELIRWGGYDFIPQIIDSSATPPVGGFFKVHIATYDILRRFTTERIERGKNKWGHEVDLVIKENPFYTFPFKTIILDEVQSIKSESSARTAEVMKICEGKENVIALSGTPIKNNAAEYGPILHILRPDIFTSIPNFIQRWVSVVPNGRGTKYGGIRNMSAFQELTKGFIIRRTREAVMPELPKINRVFHHVDWENEKLKKQYQSAEDDMINEMEKKHSGGSNTVIGAISKARHLIGVTKINPTVEKICDFLMETDRKLVVFVHHQDVMDAIHMLTTKWCLDGAYSLPLKFHAGLSSEERNNVVEQFRSNNHRVMIASTLAASEGLNLQFCSDCIMAERQWNPANEEQAEGRFIRIGQLAENVNATYLVVSQTIDEYFTQIVEEKRAAFRKTMDGVATNWEESTLMSALFNVIKNKGRKNITKGF